MYIKIVLGLLPAHYIFMPIFTFLKSVPLTVYRIYSPMNQVFLLAQAIGFYRSSPHGPNPQHKTTHKNQTKEYTF
jgi:hypothetical protein